VGEEEGEEEEGGVTPTGVGGPIEPTLPTTGVATNTSLAGLVLLGVALVAVVIIVRRLRLH
jgi:LPXTG-motif cell wall-anchored protein